MWGKWTPEEVWLVTLPWSLIAQKFGQIVWSRNTHCVVKGKVVADPSLASGAA